MGNNNKGPSYSIASCVVETGHRLVATPDHDGFDNSALRRAGRALLTAEIAGFGPIGSGVENKRHGQGLEIRLRFYNADELGHVDQMRDEVEEAVGFSIGGWPWAIQFDLDVIDAGGGWLGGGVEWPTDRPSLHLDILPREIDRRCLVQDRGLLQVLGRRLRYRIGIDHKQNSPDRFWWTTVQTEAWIARTIVGDEHQSLNRHQRRQFNGVVQELLPLPKSSVDPLHNSPDDWGFVDLVNDPIMIVSIGPKSGGQTEADVRETLGRAGDQLQSQSRRVASEWGVTDPGVLYADALEQLAAKGLARRECDVVLLFRGGFSKSTPLTASSSRRIVDAAEALVSRGIEVVIALGHGTTSVHGLADREPAVGVFEAITPTAGAAWIVREHVNNRLVNAVVDGGQPLDP
ncbi:hypothetical protein [Nesterenkonia jeotgali]|uniref:Uncharacterized protein n=1 Tax=Nesterenkonia jeotgali TaxID=317018 RepID=A0A0W8IBC6_9MICC|nr:hypothetical protein [Nesterenkonia jeotgali]KUG57265.1 hypothetical protein AVL63_13325 [Nesterenkonia jeotgali]